MIKLVRSELLKLRTTNLWWIFLILLVGLTAISFAYAAITAHFLLTSSPGDFSGMSSDQQASMVAERSPAAQAANLYTSGQYFGLLFVMLLGALVVTNEFFHQTATSTFLTTPRRSRVIAAKLAAALLLGAVFWLVATLLDVIAGSIFLGTEGYGTLLGHGSVWHAILLNLLGYVIWAMVGVGLGALIRSQIATVIIGIVIYFVTGTLAQTIASGLSYGLGWHWLPKAIVALPASASSLMIEGADLPGNPPQWVGAVVLIAWGVVAGVIGTLITRRRDVS